MILGMKAWPRDFLRLFALIGVLGAGSLASGDPGHQPASPELYRVQDTLKRDWAGVSDEARRMLDNLAWQPGDFEAKVASAPADFEADHIVRFPSAVPGGDPARDTVRLRWYRPADDGPVTAEPRGAVLVVHGLHPDMWVGRMLAGGFGRAGLEAFLIEMPGFGSRSGGAPAGVTAVTRATQAIADIRRARDVIGKVLDSPAIPIGLQATSLGGFAAVPAQALDQSFDRMVLFLTGGHAFKVLSEGKRDARRLRELLAAHGYAEPALRRVTAQIEPTQLARRLDPSGTWLFYAREDQVVAPAHAEALAEGIGLAPSHRRAVAGNHYTALLTLPAVMTEMAARISEPTAEQTAETGESPEVSSSAS